MTQPWEKDVKFLRLLAETEGHTLIDPKRLHIIYRACLGAPKTPDAAFIEVGVYKGGSARIIASAAEGSRTLLFDTFSGMPPADPAIDIHREGDFADTSMEAVSRYLSDLPNVYLIKGKFPETFGLLDIGTPVFAHIDVDIYESVKACCETLHPLMHEFGIMIFDDYGAPTCPGVKKAVDEFFAPLSQQIIHAPGCNQCVVMK